MKSLNKPENSESRDLLGIRDKDPGFIELYNKLLTNQKAQKGYRIIRNENQNPELLEDNNV